MVKKKATFEWTSLLGNENKKTVALLVCVCVCVCECIYFRLIFTFSLFLYQQNNIDLCFRTYVTTW